MKLDKQTVRRHNDDNLIPMINVVFLLLVFFMVAGTLRASDPLNLEPVKSAQQQPLTIPINLYLGADGTLILDGEILSATALISKLEVVNNDIEQPDAEPVLALKADARVTVLELRELFATLRVAGVKDIKLVTEWLPASIDKALP